MLCVLCHCPTQEDFDLFKTTGVKKQKEFDYDEVCMFLRH